VKVLPTASLRNRWWRKNRRPLRDFPEGQFEEGKYYWHKVASTMPAKTWPPGA